MSSTSPDFVPHSSASNFMFYAIRNEYYAWGLYRIAKAVSFLNNDCKLVSIFISIVNFTSLCDITEENRLIIKCVGVINAFSKL